MLNLSFNPDWIDWLRQRIHFYLNSECWIKCTVEQIPCLMYFTVVAHRQLTAQIAAKRIYQRLLNQRLVALPHLGLLENTRTGIRYLKQILAFLINYKLL